MDQKTNKKVGWYYFYLLLGAAAIWLFADHVAGFRYPQYFYDANEGIRKYIGVNVVSRWADFSYFTYQTLLFFAAWMLLLFVSYTLKWQKLHRFLTHEATVTFILTNYTVTSVLYTVFELSSGTPTFGLYAHTNAAIHNFGTNIVAHYVLYLFALGIGLKTETNGRLRKRHTALFVLYLLAYYIGVKITGMYFYEIEWYPYILFDAEALWKTFFKLPYDKTLGYVFLAGIGIAAIVLYTLLLRLFSACKQQGFVRSYAKQSAQTKKDDYALVTGATGGLGKAFVLALAKRGYDLILTGRSEEKLQAIRARAKTENPDVKVWTFAADLADEGGRYALTSKIAAHGFRISLLVNVAGADIQKAFSAYSQEKIAFQCRVNFEAAVSMCRFAIERKADSLQILNISSVSGIYPMPYFAVYSATKAALTAFSVALREEQKENRVAVTAVLPGAMPTREDIKEQIKGQGLWGKLAAKSPESVVEASLKAVDSNKPKVVVGFWNKAMKAATCWLPSSWRLAFIAKRWKKISKDAF